MKRIIFVLFVLFVLFHTISFPQASSKISLHKSFPSKESKAIEELLSLPTDFSKYKNEYYVCDIIYGQIKVFDKDGKFIRAIGKKGHEKEDFSEPLCFTVNTNNGDLYVFDQALCKIIIFNNKGTFVDAIKIVGTINNLYFYNKNLYALCYDTKKGFNIAVFKDKSITKVFGEISDSNILSDEKRIKTFYSLSHLIHYKNQLIEYSPFTPDIYITNTSDNKIKKVRLKGKDLLDSYENNLAPKKAGVRVLTKWVYSDIIMDDKYLYCFNNQNPNPCIVVHDMNGNITKNITISGAESKNIHLLYIDGDEFVFYSFKDGNIEIFR